MAPYDWLCSFEDVGPAVLALLPGPEARVLVVGCGNSPFSSELFARGYRRLTNVDNCASVVAAQRDRYPMLEWVVGDCRALPFGDGAFDVACVGQAFHWFANEHSLVELGRVLADGGRLALLWNLEDDSEPWVRDVREAYEVHDTGAQGDVPQYRKGRWRAAFETPGARAAFPGGCESAFFDNFLLTTREEIWERALSKSYCATLPPDQRDALVAEIAAIVDHYEASGALAFDVARPGDGAPCARLPINSEVAVAVRGARA